MTKKAMGDLNKKLKFRRGTGQELGDLWAVRINSGKFGVPWPRTKRILEQCGMDLTIVYPVEEDEEHKVSGKKTPKSVSSSKTATPSASDPGATTGEAEVEQHTEVSTVAKEKSKKQKKRKSEVTHDEGQKKKKEKADRKPEKLDIIPRSEPTTKSSHCTMR